MILVQEHKITIKHSPVVQLAILSLHVLTTRGQTLTETPTDEVSFSGQSLGDAIKSVLEHHRFSLDCIQSINDSRLDNASVSAWCSRSYNGSYLLCSNDELESVSQYLCPKSRINGSYPATSLVDKETTSTHGDILGQRNNLRALLLENTRNKDIILSINTYLSNRCKRYMTAGLQKLIAPKGCTFLESIKSRLHKKFICANKEYDTIHVAVCGEANNTRHILMEKSLRNTGLGEIQNGVSDFCYSSLFPNSVEVSANLILGCQRLQSFGRNLVTRTICSQREIDILTSELCFPPVERVSNEQRRRDEINDVVHNDVTESCREAMLSRKTNMRGKTVDEACQILRVFRDILLNSEFCTTEDYAKLEVVTCGRGHRERLSTVMTLLCLLLLAFTR